MTSSSLRFTKMHGLGNDFVLLDTRNGAGPLPDTPDLARRLCDRHLGIGADGILILSPPTAPGADLAMSVVNADGAPAEMCGNGLRCVAWYAAGAGDPRAFRVQTDAGVLATEILTPASPEGPARVRTELGVPEVQSIIKEALGVADRDFQVTCISMGNPHCVVFLPEGEDLEGFPVARYGAAIETADRFPRRTNVEFVTAPEPGLLVQRTWERGCGETLACGTGAAATAVAAVLSEHPAVSGRETEPVRVRLRGGEVTVQWSGPGAPVFVTGPAVRVFTGEWTREVSG